MTPSPPAPPQESFADLAFPGRGVDLARGYGQQLPGTTPAGANVRTFEALTQRGRGGARPGLVQFVPQALPLSYVSGLRVIQHLNLIVDPQALAQADSGPDPTGDVLDDPSDDGLAPSWATGTTTRNPGRKVRRGGSGIQPTKNRSKTGFAIFLGFGHTVTGAGADQAIYGLAIKLNGATLDSFDAAAPLSFLLTTDAAMPFLAAMASGTPCPSNPAAAVVESGKYAKADVLAGNNAVGTVQFNTDDGGVGVGPFAFSTWPWYLRVFSMASKNNTWSITQTLLDTTVNAQAVQGYPFGHPANPGDGFVQTFGFVN